MFFLGANFRRENNSYAVNRGLLLNEAQVGLMLAVVRLVAEGS